jgi:hypothetical protein
MNGLPVEGLLMIVRREPDVQTRGCARMRVLSIRPRLAGQVILLQSLMIS